MPKPRPEADMLHMQHANVVAVLVRQHEAVRLKAERDAVAKARREAAAPATGADALIPIPRRARQAPSPRTA